MCFKRCGAKNIFKEVILTVFNWSDLLLFIYFTFSFNCIINTQTITDLKEIQSLNGATWYLCWGATRGQCRATHRICLCGEFYGREQKKKACWLFTHELEGHQKDMQTQFITFHSWNPLSVMKRRMRWWRACHARVFGERFMKVKVPLY